ncbi:aldo-keto reductase family 1 member B1-like isoform X2 [Ptychodera flava]|uniref:aldo-keto reductase family 1 member B1-like isoform X2 n=1 Tax=Ptychodera flava TaxID=63121 RepID=UPI00396A4FA5
MFSLLLRTMIISSPTQVSEAVKSAIDIGYRHIDCASIYENEHEVGTTLAIKLNDGTIRREDIFITSKLWGTYMRPELVRESCLKSLKNLQLDYLDLYLMHIPAALKPGKEILPTDEAGEIICDDVDYIDTWKVMEKLVDEGLCKSIGVSNFNEEQLCRLLSVAKHPISVNQVECHPYLAQQKLVNFCKSNDIVITAYSPLGCPGRPLKFEDTDPRLLEDPVVCDIGKSYNKTPGQVLIRYHIERGIVVIPKSANENRIGENFQVFDFKLSEDDMSKLNSLDKNYRILDFAFLRKHKHFPFECQLSQ